MSTATTLIEIHVNGEPLAMPAGATVADLVTRLELPADRVAVELDRRIVRRPEWSRAALQAGSSVELVQLVGGG